MSSNTATVHLECAGCEKDSKYPLKAFDVPEHEDKEPEVGDTVGAHECEECGKSTHIITEVPVDE